MRSSCNKEAQIVSSRTWTIWIPMRKQVNNLIHLAKSCGRNYSKERMSHLVAQQPLTMVAVDSANGVIGFLDCEIVNDMAIINWIGVDKDSRRIGVAENLIERIKDIVATGNAGRDLKGIRVDVSEYNLAMHLLMTKKCGFKYIKTIKDSDEQTCYVFEYTFGNSCEADCR